MSAEKDPVKDVIIQSLEYAGKEGSMDLAEIGIDTFLTQVGESSFLIDIPIAKYLALPVKIGLTIREAAFIKRFSAFIGPIQFATGAPYFPDTLYAELCRSPVKWKMLVENTIIALDRYHTELKAALLGVAFRKTFIDKIFSITEYNQIIFDIEYIHPANGLSCMKIFYDYRNELLAEEDQQKRMEIEYQYRDVEFSPLGMTGFLCLPKGGSYTGDTGGAFISKYGIKFFENVVLDPAIKRWLE